MREDVGASLTMTDTKRPISPELRRIADDLQRMFVGNAWHGPSVSDALTNVTSSMAIAASLPGAHNIFELTHHIAAWVGEVTHRLKGGKSGEPTDGDFPAKDATVDDAGWTALLTRVAARHEELIGAILAFDAARLDEVIGRAEPNDAANTYRKMLHGVIAHDAYHAGQIVLLRNALG
ncbi:MAG: DinB family protein [Gemmatimonadaceae bacterium]